MGTKRKRAKRGMKKYANYTKRGKMKRCAHVDRSTGIRCSEKVIAVKSKLRTFCKQHKWRHDSRHKTRVIVRKNNKELQE